MCQVNEVVDVALVVSHSGLVGGEAPVAIYYELILMLGPLKLHIAQKFVSPTLLHGDAVCPLAE